jgi:hypothetical protein
MREGGILKILAAGLIAGGAFAADLPCSLGKYRIPDTKTVAIDCVKRLAAIEGEARLFLVQQGSATGTSIQTGSLSAHDFNWVVIQFPMPLDGGKDYEVRFAGKAASRSADPPFAFDEALCRFSTRPGGVLTIPKRMKATDYFYGSELWIESPIELDPASLASLVFESQDAPGIFVPHPAAAEMEPRTGLDAVGTVRLTFKQNDAPKQLNSRMRVTGLKDIFGQPVAISMKKRLAPASSPKAKDESVYYSKLLQQAGFNSRPAWILDGKLAPPLTLRRLANWQLRPSAEADIGEGGAIGKTKTNDYIRFALALGKFLRTERLGVLQGIDPAFGAAYETNYSGAKKNVLFVFDNRFYLAGTDESRKLQNFLKFIEAKKTDPAIEPQDAPRAFFGYQLRASFGLDAGSQISDQGATASDGSSRVTVRGYRIARIRPKLELALEFGRITLNLSGTPRYLANTENVYRERDSLTPDGKTRKEIYVDTVTGWRPSGDIVLSIALDDAGHYALSSALKLGSLPPNFQRVAIVQSGLTIKF